MSKKVGCTPTSSIGELTIVHMCILAWQSLLLTSYLSYGFLSPTIVLIDVSLSHLFVFFLHHLSISPFRCQLFSHAHPLHECSKYRKGVDHFDLYLASGMGTSPDKIPKETKFETVVDLVFNNKKFSLSYSQSPFLHANKIWRHSCHGQRELLHLLFLCCLFQC